MKDRKDLILSFVIIILFFMIMGLSLYILQQSDALESLGNRVAALEENQIIATKQLTAIKNKSHSENQYSDSARQEYENLEEYMAEQAELVQTLSYRFISLGRTFISLENRVNRLKGELEDVSVDLGSISVEKKEEVNPDIQ
jgi:ABC-type multidrug transport system ATPase subunit